MEVHNLTPDEVLEAITNYLHDSGKTTVDTGVITYEIYDDTSMSVTLYPNVESIGNETKH